MFLLGLYSVAYSLQDGETPGFVHIH